MKVRSSVKPICEK
ncbi:MAG: 50S ribosomal protein L36, partial [Clostridiales bacterium]|nr:50S ribosomal protein L36 [Lachnospiraceae bacterium]NMA93106.1 50S ribosomal protein L36 [Clostridiales bacterium]